MTKDLLQQPDQIEIFCNSQYFGQSSTWSRSHKGQNLCSLGTVRGLTRVEC